MYLDFNSLYFVPVEKQKKDIRSRLKDIEIPKNLVTLGNVVQEGKSQFLVNISRRAGVIGDLWVRPIGIATISTEMQGTDDNNFPTIVICSSRMVSNSRGLIHWGQF